MGGFIGGGEKSTGQSKLQLSRMPGKKGIHFDLGPVKAGFHLNEQC